MIQKIIKEGFSDGKRFFVVLNDGAREILYEDELGSIEIRAYFTNGKKEFAIFKKFQEQNAQVYQEPVAKITVDKKIEREEEAQESIENKITKSESKEESKETGSKNSNHKDAKNSKSK